MRHHDAIGEVMHVHSLTILFEDPFWIGLFESIEEDQMQVCKVTFGAEPTELEVQEFTFGTTDAILIGSKSESVFLFLHGNGGSKEEAIAFAQVAVPHGYQVIGIDVPVMGKPWKVLEKQEDVKDFLKKNHKSISIRANSIGAWFSMQAFNGEKIDQALFVSPLLDMKAFIERMLEREEDYYLTSSMRHPN